MSGTLTLNIESSSIRAVVVDGKRVVRWADAPLPVGVVVGGVVGDPGAAAGILKKLVDSLKVGHVRPIVSVSGIRSFYRYLSVPRMAKPLLDKAVRHDLEDLVHVPQEQLYITWTRMRISGTEDNVFVVATPRGMVDSIIQTVRMAGLKMPFLGCKPLALARLAGAKDAVLVDIETDILCFVVVRHGRPVTIRTVPLGNWNAVGLLGQLREELDTTLRLYESTYPEDTVAIDIPVWLSGVGVQAIESIQVLADKLQRPVGLVPPVLKHPVGMPWPNQAVNVGLALRLTGLLRARYSAVPGIDILPPSYRPSPRPVKQLVLGPVVAIGILMVAFTYQAYDEAVTRSELAAAETKAAQEKMRLKQAEVKKRNDLREALVQAEAALRTIQTERGMLVPDTPQFLETLNAVYSQAGDQIVLGIVSQDAGKLIIHGTALDHWRVLGYADRLTASKAFSKVDIRESSMVLLTDKEEGMYQFGVGEEARIPGEGDTVSQFTITVTR